ncbi:phosphatidylinositol 4,5-bisphosphate 3-kinase catalytic subunit beta isoform [Paramuricea clavata]|uniref:phosphatidylinositol 3-kinase n=2 Tax=Paramuricea clavata TaxID=317549 RepID=A0A6S7JVF4_PARCT|nr:phosphatidylinositol 4,5-bisphosphate 3-kinase catalytic subunit beta isoform [Paramuricea clavata]
MTLFDFRNYLRQGQIILHAWPVKDNLQDLNPIGTVVSNINTSTSACLIIEFSQYAKPGTSVVYPPFDKVLEKASTLAGNEQKDIFRGGEKTNIDLQLLTQREPLAEYTEHEKKKIWFFRFECRDNFPNSLPKVLLSIQWNNHEDVARMHALLQCWPRIAPEQALELLDYKYPEKEVRDYAVQCLENFSDGQLHMYLLQLVQVLKYEAYLDCHLAKFLLRRALWNRKIGHSLFWLLRAEMHVPEVSVRFGLLLEAYCRGCVAHMASLSKQVEAMNKLKAITELLQCHALKRTDRDKCIETMKECLQQVTFREAFSDFHSVVDPTCKLKSLRVDGCNVMDSKMRPLWMVYENDDEMGAPTTLIFKNGDDLRQDMLTVQIFKIMDTLWQREGLNLQMTPYSVLPTGDKIGVIEVVTRASTLANIQKSEGGVVRGAFKKEVLLGWLKSKNRTDEMLKRAIEAFTMSCAGYCVATYVLGVGDRHSDNIMVKETGQLVHIDFGHFLGNFKVKFGVNRERVPFILSRDFVYVITNGQKSDKCSEFLRFREICERAYLILRKHNYLFINLFTMMLSTGLPELRSVKDIEYLKKTLGLNSGQMNAEEAEKAALLKFRKCFDEAYKNSTSTSLNWAIHNWARDNR